MTVTRTPHALVLAHRLFPAHEWVTAKAAVHRNSEVAQIARRRCLSTLESVDAVDREHDAEEHSSITMYQARQRFKETIFLAS